MRESDENWRIVLAQGDVECALRCTRWSSWTVTLLRRHIFYRGEDIRRRGKSVARNASGGYYFALEKKFSLMAKVNTLLEALTHISKISTALLNK